MTPKREGPKNSRIAPVGSSDGKTLSTGDRPESAASATTSKRKPWKKRTPVEVVLEQIDKLRQDVKEKDEELKQAKQQLQKLEEVAKALEAL